MKAISVLSTPTLLAAAGNRDFLHIYNNGSETIFLCYDGDPGGIPSGAVTGIQHNTRGSGTTIVGLSLNSSTGLIVPGMVVSGTGIPASVYVTAYDAVLNNVTVTSFTSTAQINAGDTITFTPGVTVDDGWPVPSGTWYNLDNDGNRNLFNKPVYAIAVTGPVNVRLQGV